MEFHENINAVYRLQISVLVPGTFNFDWKVGKIRK